MANDIDFSKSQLEMLKQILEYPNDFKYPLGSKVYSNDIDFLNKQGLCGEWERVEGAFIFGASDSYPADGVVRGSATVQLKIEHMPSHRHDGYSTESGSSECGQWSGGSSPFYNEKTVYKNRCTSMSLNGGDKPHENMPPYIAKYMWIKTKLESETNGTLGVMVI